MNALLPETVRARGGHTAGQQAAVSGRLRKAGLAGAEKSREIARQWREKQDAVGKVALNEQETEEQGISLGSRGGGTAHAGPG